MSDLLNEVHYIDLQAPSHVYCLSKVNHQSVRAVIAAATFKLVAIEAIETQLGNVRWNTYQLPLPKDGRGIEIISLNSFNQLNKENSPIIAYTTVETTYLNSPVSSHNTNGNTNGPPELSEEIKRSFYLNICGTNSSDKNSWEEIAEDRQILKLDYTPFKITNIRVAKDRQYAILVSGSDCQLHLYKQDDKRQWIEHRLQAYFPELTAELTSCVLSIDIEEGVINEQNHRFIALGCQDGSVVLFISNLDTKQSQKHAIWLDGPISALKLYKCHAPKRARPSAEPKRGTVSPVIDKIRKQLNAYAEDRKKSKQKSVKPSFPNLDYHVDLAVAGAIGYAVIFHHVIEHGFETASMLNNSDTFDAVMSINVADVDWDGHMEILLSTYGQQLVVYKDTRHSHKSKPVEAQPSSAPMENKRRSTEIANTNSGSGANLLAGSLSNRPVPPLPGTGAEVPMSSTPKRSQITQLLQEMSMNQGSVSSTDSSPAVTPVKPRSRRGSRAQPDEPLQHDGIMINHAADVPGSVYHPSGEDWIDPSVPRPGHGGLKALKGRSFSFTRSMVPSPMKVNLNATEDEDDEELDDADEIYQLAAQISFAHPIFDLLVSDVTNDGLDDVVITSMYGVHVFQLNIHAAKQRLTEKFALLKRIHELEQLLGNNNDR